MINHGDRPVEDWAVASIHTMGLYAIIKIQTAIGECEITHQQRKDVVWKSVEFMPEKFENALDVLLEDIVKGKIFYFLPLPAEHDMFTDIVVLNGYGISIRIICHKEFVLKLCNFKKSYKIEYMGHKR